MPEFHDTPFEMPLPPAAPPPPAPPLVDTDGSAAPRPPALTDFVQRQVVQQLAAVAAEEDDFRYEREARFLLFTAVPGGLASLVVHLLLLISLGAYMLISDPLGGKTISIEVVEGEDEEFQEELFEQLAIEITTVPEPTMEDPLENEELWNDETFDTTDDLVSDDLSDLLDVMDQADARVGPAERIEGQVFVAHTGGGAGLSARAQRRRQALAYGATPESENAVELALLWLVRHQQGDGSWSFNHQQGPTECAACRCQHPGLNYAGAKNGATAISMLALLGAGQTHLEGEYRDAVAGGLRYLLEHQKKDGSFFENGGRMYSHGLATLALCEALAMTRYQDAKPIVRQQTADDPNGAATEMGAEAEATYKHAVAGIEPDELLQAAQLAVQFLEKAQHRAGGWRYTPREAGDTSVVGWQMMALKSGYLAGVAVDQSVLKRAIKFLDHVSEDQIGSVYGYQAGRHAVYLPPDHAIGATTPIGLLCRMYTGWDREEPGLQAGVERIGYWARPSRGMYFYYYATQVMHHHGGGPWHKWNAWMRDYLVQSQGREGSETGSWYFDGPHDNSGRLYCTAMAAMTLEVYYRYSPIYGTEVLLTPP